MHTISIQPTQCTHPPLTHILPTSHSAIQSIQPTRPPTSPPPSNTGALKKAAENVANAPDRQPPTLSSPNEKKKKKVVKVSIIEAFSKDVEAKDLETTLRMEYR